ncbi:MAG: sodium-dependent transporter [Candidatus Omnitrophota bacterium]|nr:MAG: sodium-dependent transporter [Candidatus Omnitrophota bacterium]
MKKRETWGTHIGMLLAMIGTEVGLGNIWRFPYLCGKYGGSAFLIPYLILLFSVAVFAMMCEWALGRFTRRDPLGAFEKINFPQGTKIGAWGIIGPFFLYAYYIVITSWVLFYAFASLGRLFPKDTETFFVNFLSSPTIFLVHIICVGICSTIIGLGVRKGIERASKFMISTLFILLLIVVLRAITLPGAGKGFDFYMHPRWREMWSLQAWGAALGQIFFTLSLGMGAMIIYGSYLKEKIGIPKNALACALGNTSVSLLAGFAIFPAAFALGMEEVVHQESIGLTFIVLPQLFMRMPFGWFFAFLFFLLLLFGALSSAISIQEPSVAWLIEERNWSRKRSALFTGTILWILGLPFILNGWAKGGLGEKLSLLSKMDTIIGQLALPFFSLLAVIAVGWVMKEGFEQINKNAYYKLPIFFKGWIRWGVPLFIFFLFISTLLKNIKEIFNLSVSESTLLMTFIVCLIVWGGFAFFTHISLKIEKRKV